MDVFVELNKLMKHMCSTRRTAPVEFYKAIATRFDQYRTGEQQDSYEFLIFLLRSLHNALTIDTDEIVESSFIKDLFVGVLKRSLEFELAVAIVISKLQIKRLFGFIF